MSSTWRSLAGAVLALCSVNGWIAVARADQPNGSVALRGIYLSADASHGGEYTGLWDSGGHLALDLSTGAALPWAGDDAVWQFDATNLGLDTYAAAFELTRQGHYALLLALDGSQQYTRGDGRTPYAGDDSLRLPGSWLAGQTTAAMLAFDGLARRFDQEKSRDSVSFEASYVFGPHFSASAGFRHENTSGNQVQGGSIYLDATRGNAVLLPTPIDYRRQDVNTSLRFASERLNTTLTWQFEWFDNQQDRLLWDNPFSGVAAPATDYPAGRGGLALAPDHERQALRLDGHLQVSDGFSLQWDGALARTDQDNQLDPYSVNPALLVGTAVPLDDLDASLRTTSVDLRANYRPRHALLRKLSLRAAWHFDERDYHKSRDLYVYVRGDGADQPAAALGIFDTAHDRQRQGWDVRADYRLPWWRGRLSGAYRFDETRRDNAAVRSTETGTWRTALRLTPVAALGTRLEYTFSDRRASTYRWEQTFLARRSAEFINQVPDDQRFDNHPALRQFHLANAEIDRIEFGLSWAGIERWYFAADVQWQNINYDRSELGLTETLSWQPGIEVQFTPRNALSLFMHAAFTRYETDAAGRSFGGGIEQPAFVRLPPLPQGSDPRRNWFADTTDDVWTVGGGVRWQVSERLELDGTATVVTTESDQRFANGGSPFIDAAPLPTVRTRLTEISLQADYAWRSNLSSALEYRYLRYAEDDYALDNVQPTTLPDVLTLGEGAHNEAVNLISVSLRYDF